MRRRVTWVAGLVVALLTLGVMPASAVGSLGSPQVLVPSCGTGRGDASMASDGTLRGFAECNGNPYGPIWFFRHRPGVAPAKQLTPYTGTVLAAAWDAAGSTYVVFEQDSQLKIGKRIESTGAYTGTTTLSTTGAGAVFYTADLVASGGKWWVVWSEQVGATEFAQTELFQAHTLLGSQTRTRITTTADNVDDAEPALAYAGGKVTMVWTRTTNPYAAGPADLRLATTTGGAWSSRAFATAGDQNFMPNIVVYNGLTYVTWVRDFRIVVADNASGAFVSRTFATPGYLPSVAASYGKVFVAWAAGDSDATSRVFLAERAGGTWTGAYATGAPAAPLQVLAQAGKARVLYRTSTEVRVRTQL